MTSRRDLIKAGAMAAMAGAVPSSVTLAEPAPELNKPGTGAFWPDGARMVISVSMQMEGGAQPTSGAESPMPKIDPKYPDLPASKWYDYGYKEGLPRLLEVFDRRKIKVTSHMVGAAVDLHPALAKKTADGFTYLDSAQFHEYFAADLSAEQAAFMARSQVLNLADNFKAVITTAAWRSKPSWMLVATKDRTINPDLERWYATRANSHKIEVSGASHAVYVSRPKEVAALIEEAASHAR